MKRLLHISLLLMALLGLMGQSTAMAIMPAGGQTSPTKPMQLSMAGMECVKMANSSVPGKSPCKHATPQCMAAMGCAPAALVVPSALPTEAFAAGRMASTLSLAARLWGRSYGPEPHPPSLLV